MVLVLASCSLPLPDKPVRPQLYDLGPAALPAAADAQPDAAALVFDPVVAPAAIDGTQIIYRLAYSDGGQQPRPYASARWTMPPPQLIGQRLREVLAARRPVIDAGTGFAALELRAELDEFAQVFSAADVSEGVVRLRVTATMPAARGNRLLGQRTFIVRKPAATADALGGATALRAASDEVAREVADWVDTLSPPPPPSH